MNMRIHLATGPLQLIEPFIKCHKEKQIKKKSTKSFRWDDQNFNIN